MHYGFKELVDLRKLQKLTDRLYAATSIPASIVTVDGEILTGSGWQRICTDFHRKHPRLENECIQSDTFIRNELSVGEPYVIYKCPRGLVDASAPILIEGKHVANIFSGQVFLDPPDEAMEHFFRQQARKYGFDEEDYLAAFREVPVFTKQKFRDAISFLADFANLIADMGLARLKELKAMEVMRESERKYRELVENANSIILKWEKDGTIDFLNEYGREFFGYHQDEIIGKSVIGTIVPDIESGGRDLHKLMADIFENPQKYEKNQNQNMKKDGARVWIAWTNRPVCDEKGDVVLMLSVGVDITELKNTEAELTQKRNELFERNQVLDAVLGHTHMMAVYLDTAFNFIWVNQAYAETCKKERSFFAGKNHFDLYPHAENEAVFQTVVDTGKEFYTEAKPFEFPDQPERGVTYWDWSLIPVKDEMGKAKGLVFTLIEVTDRIKAEESLRLSEEKFRLIAETSVEDIWQLDLNGKVTYVSPAVERIFGYTQQEAVGLGLESFFIQAEIASAAAAFAKAIAGEEYQLLEFTAKRKGGTAFPVEVSVTPIKKDERIVGVQGIARDITKRKKLEETLQESEHRYRTIFEQNLNPIAIISADGQYIETNEAFQKFTETDAQKLLEMNAFDFSPPEMQKEQEKQHRPAWSKGGTFETEYFVNGKRKVLYLTVTPIKYQGRKAVVGIGTDITQQKETEAALRASEEKFRLAFYTSPDSINLNRLEDGRYIDINEGFTKVMGYFREDVIGKTSTDLNIWNKAVDRARLVKELRRYGYVENFEAEFTAKDGTVKDGLMSARILRLDGQDVVLSITRDISDRKRIEKSLQDSEKKWRSYVNEAPYGIFIADRKGRYIEVNPAAGRITGYSEAELLKMSIADMLPDDAMEIGLAHFKRCIDEGVSVGEADFKHKNGDRRNWTVSAVRLNEDRFLGFVEDTTDRKRLEQRVQQAQKMESIGNLAGGIAHDFNNILFPIVGMSEMLLDDLPEGSFEHENVQEIYNAGKRGSELVKQILAFSRQTEHRMMPVRMQAILKEVLRLIRSTIPSDIEITHSIDGSCGQIMADPTQVHQVAMNLITNAYHALGESGGKIHILLAEVDIGNETMGLNTLEPGRFAQLSISDNGCGIDPDMMGKIFEPYFTTKEKGKGTGLGLSVVHGIAKEHGGDVSVVSELGKGTTFRVYFPIMEKPADSLTPVRGERYQTGTENILLVDDEMPVVNLLRQMLERMGYQVAACTSSIDALRMFEASPSEFDLVISDMTMPNMTGDQLVRELISIRPEIPVIICTGFSERINREKAELMGVKGFLLKPIVRSDLAQTVRQVLDQAGRSTGN